MRGEGVPLAEGQYSAAKRAVLCWRRDKYSSVKWIRGLDEQNGKE